MIGIDTNTLVNTLVRDDPDTAHAASDVIGRLIEAEPGFVFGEALVDFVRPAAAARCFER